MVPEWPGTEAAGSRDEGDGRGGEELDRRLQKVEDEGLQAPLAPRVLGSCKVLKAMGLLSNAWEI